MAFAVRLRSSPSTATECRFVALAVRIAVAVLSLLLLVKTSRCVLVACGAFDSREVDGMRLSLQGEHKARGENREVDGMRLSCPPFASKSAGRTAGRHKLSGPV